LEVFINMETKFCNGCQTDLPRTDEFFASRHDRGDKQFQSLCRKCQKEYRKKHYNDNKQKYITKANLYTKSLIDWFNEIKKNLKCDNCSESRFWVLDFHHRDPKEKDIEVSTLVRKGNKQKILDEMAKCLVLCSNCHRDLHYQEKLNK